MIKVNELVERLKGRKTYILSSLGLGVIGTFLLGLLDLDTTVAILALLGFGSVATLRDAISNLEANIADLG